MMDHQIVRYVSMALWCAVYIGQTMKAPVNAQALADKSVEDFRRRFP